MSKKSKPEASFKLLVTALGRDRGEVIVTAEPGEIAFLESFRYAVRIDIPTETDVQIESVVAEQSVVESGAEQTIVAPEAITGDDEDGDQLLDQV